VVSAFALMIGIAVGTYSSLFNATPIAYDLIMRQRKNKERNNNSTTFINTSKSLAGGFFLK
jgi:preprotein translocase subunit SecF